MFKKESLVYGIVNLPDGYTKIDYQKAEDWRKGAEFGYNKCKEELNQKGLALQSDMDKTIEQNIALKKELDKANEWHYVKDGKYPTHSNRVLVFTDEGVGFGIYGLDDKKWHTYDTGFDVIAWREIPTFKEE